ncbi:MAG: OmpH family outer membrane protein [Bacteroidetes bacterium]|uniref:OmpH family outer membrane protein n=1 Tax=Phaeocystidibacter marisrubri TaxID=1577780 RepID=A0A6L3ZD52_9FLAO|nr:OmpH family outer membrane protein [Phaeocystidibacter marisrubri]KAB2815279.1 OmpH family outer membrane protein [Phaeocystidibacter marisrubri]TNE31551.1 MAG: OmpH family outer membrane protein [Bacteroidota bacterium]GGH71271.1 hypothetical protein GCM10011318_14120 [Phaeocystidibacter marisrubri]
MKRIFKMFAVAAMFLSTTAVFGQAKIGHCNTDSLIVLMPEYKTAMETLETQQAQYESELKQMQTELTQLSQTFEAQKATYSQLRLERDSQDLQNRYQRMQEFAQDAQKRLSEQEQQLLLPVIEKLQEAINQVAKDKGLDYVLDSSRRNGVVIFKNDSKDISTAVKTKLGLI